MSVPDGAIATYGQLAAAMPPDAVAVLGRAATAGGSAANEAKRQVARAIVALYHGESAADRAEQRFDALHRHHEVPGDAPVAELPAGDPVHLPQVLVSTGLVPSRSAGRRALDEGAVRIDGVVVPGGAYDLRRSEVAGRVLSLGRRRAVRLNGDAR